jgi:hypothetical protein
VVAMVGGCGGPRRRLAIPRIGDAVITAILILSIANVLLQLIAVWQRHAQLQAHRGNGDREGAA